jgi:hypothetical protein
LLSLSQDGADPNNNAAGRRGEQAIPSVSARFRRKLRVSREHAKAQVWESLHSLLTWLGIISLISFDLSTIDPSLEQQQPLQTGGDNNNDEDTAAETLTTVATLVQSILATLASHLTNSGMTWETAALCLASLLSRLDLEGSELERFVAWLA